MSQMTAAERVMCVLRNEEPDRIPHFEWILDHRVRQAICPGCSMEEFTVRMELDAIEGWRSRGEISTSTYASLRRDIMRASLDVAALKRR